MKLNVEGLSRHLEKNLLPVYLIHGDEPLLALETLDLLHQQAKAQGFSELIKIDAEQGNVERGALNELTQNYSLFGDKRRIQLQIGEKLSEDIETWLLDFLEALPQTQDSCLFIKAPKLNQTQLKKKWVQQVEQLGAVITLWEVDRDRLPQWVFQRAEGRGVKLSRDAVQYIVDHTEGNLLAVAQLIEKLALLKPLVLIQVEDVHPLLASDARYNVFDLSESVLRGEIHRALNILDSLKAENSEPILILWALSKELRILASLTHAPREQLPALYKQHYIWEKRQVHYQKALTRLKHLKVLQLLCDAQKIDLSIKGLDPQNPWHALKHLILGFCVN